MECLLFPIDDVLEVALDDCADVQQSIHKSVSVKISSVALPSKLIQVILQETVLYSVEVVCNHALCVADADMHPRQHLANVLGVNHLADMLCKNLIFFFCSFMIRIA